MISGILINAAAETSAFFVEANDTMVEIKALEGKIERKRVTDWMEYIKVSVVSATEEFQQMLDLKCCGEYKRSTIMSCKSKLHEIYGRFTSMSIYSENKLIFAPYFVEFASFYIKFIRTSVLVMPELLGELVEKLEKLKECITDYRESAVSERIAAVSHTRDDIREIMLTAGKIVGTFGMATRYPAARVIDTMYPGKGKIDRREFYTNYEIDYCEHNMAVVLYSR